MAEKESKEARDVRRRCYDVIIVGGGPAGIFTALELSRHSALRVLLLEKGADLARRRCVARAGSACAHCSPCHITSGWGGAGAFSDGKLTLSSEVGGWLSEHVGEAGMETLIAEVDRVYREFGAPTELYGDQVEAFERWADLAARQGLCLVRCPVRHLGTERAAAVLAAMRAELEERVDIATEAAVAQVLVEEGRRRSGRRAQGSEMGHSSVQVTGVVTGKGQVFESPTVVLAPGRDGAAWLAQEVDRLGISRVNNPVDIGVRVEVPAVLTDPITDELYEPKLIYCSRYFEDQVRTFCMNPHGVVCTESWGDTVTVNGHSYAEQACRTSNTNFALLVSTRFTQPFKEPIEYGKSIARLANILGKDILVQRLGDLRAGHRSTPERLARSVVRPTLASATPGDLSFALPYRHLRDVVDMLEALDGLIPGVGGRDTLLYGVEVKFYSSRVALNSHLETPVAGLYAVGDGAGVTRGLVQASASGLVAARAILAQA